jgi:hypothetical protein
MKGSSKRLGTEFVTLVDQAKKMVAVMNKEEGETIKFYLKQGMQLRNRDVLKEALDKAAVAPAGFIDKELVTQASDMLKELDLEHVIKFYLTAAIKQKDLPGLEAALAKATAIKMTQASPEMAEATKLHAELKAKKEKKSKHKKQKSIHKKGEAKGEKKWLLFGGDLAEAVKRSDQEIPKICYQCMDYLTQNALKEPGLFRVPGNNDEIEAMKKKFQNGEEVEFKDLHDVAGVFKLYLRKLPEPLIPFDLYPSFMKVAAQYKAGNEKRTEEFEALLQKLPKDNFSLMKALCLFLVNVASYKDVNKMTSDNLAIVFAPNLLRPKEETPQSMMVEMPMTIGVIKEFIDEYETIFGPIPENANAGASGGSSEGTSSSPALSLPVVGTPCLGSS